MSDHSKNTQEHLKQNSILSISSKYIHDCITVSKLMQEHGIVCDITPNQSIRKGEYQYNIENGCRLRFVETEPEKVVSNVWPKLKEKFNLDCAHYKVKNEYNGCINDYKSSSPKTSPFLYQ